MQYLSTTMACHFLRLSIIRIFPRTDDQAKNAALQGTLVRQTLFQEKQKP
jgi:hypothetical protein